VAWDELSAPLGQDKRKKPPKLPVAVPKLVAAGLGLFVLALVVWAVFANDPLGGEPTAVVAIPSASKQAERTQQSPAGAPDTTGAIKAPAQAIPPGSKTITIIDGSSGKRQEVVVPGNAKDDATKH